MKRFIRLDRKKRAACFILLIGLLCATCIKSPLRSSQSTLSDLRAATPPSGWVESSGAYQEFGDTGAFAVLYDSVYLMNNALKGGFRTTYLNASETTTVAVLVIDYGTAANAAAVWDTLKRSRADNNHPVDLPNFASSAKGSQSYNGLVVFAYFKGFYIELTFNNYPDPVKAVSDAEAFLGRYKAVAEK